jgi:ribosome-associated protein
MAGPIEIRPGFTVLPEDLSWKFSRSSGPGGQSVNTSDSRVSLSFDVANSPSVPDHLRARMLSRLATRLSSGVLSVHVDTERSQLQNRAKAEARLAELLRTASEPPPKKRRATRPSAGATARRLDAKKQRGEVKRLRRNTPDD